MLKGIAASTGIGIGKAVVVRPATIEVSKQTVLNLDEEKQRFLDAVEIFVCELEQAQATVRKNVGADEAAILGAQIAIIRDVELIKEVLRTIERQRVNAEYAFHIICNGYIALFSHIEDELIAARAADFQDIRDRMLRILMGLQKVDLSVIPEGSILIAEDIPPSDAAGIDSQRIAGILTQRGTRYSHISIIARALQLPAVVAVDELFERVKGGETLILDGNSGYVWINPDEARLLEYKRYINSEVARQKELEKYRDQPTVTLDGRQIRLAANIAVDQELPAIKADRADGIGLYRTEFLFMDRSAPPSEDEQYAAYKQVVTSLDGKPVVVRTLDIGGDKDIPYLLKTSEENPFLGHRAVRFCLDRPDIFKTQLAAILRASVHGNVQVMVPMITSISELRAVKAMIAEVEAELSARGQRFSQALPLGIMVETPAAALCSRELAQECSFFSIGTNDLTQYTLAVDRSNSNVAGLYNPLHPAVLRLISMTVQAGQEAGIPVSVCGEAASDPMAIPLLVGLGVDELSVSAGAVLSVRSQVNALSHHEWRRVMPRILGMKTAEQVKQFVEEKLQAMNEGAAAGTG